MEKNVLCRVIVSASINKTDRILLAKLFAKAFDLSVPSDYGYPVIEGYVSHDDFSAFCVLEDFDLVTVIQL